MESWLWLKYVIPPIVGVLFVLLMGGLPRRRRRTQAVGRMAKGAPLLDRPPSPYHVGLMWGVVGTIFVCCAGALGMENLLPAWARLWLWSVGVVGMLTTMAVAEVLRRRGWVWNATGIKTGFLLVAALYMFPVFFNLQTLLEAE